VRIHAYILAADPTWLATSVLAYYGHVDRIVVSYDEDGRGWSGARVAVDSCLNALRDLDTGQKLKFAPGRFSAVHMPSRDLVAADTRQRIVAFERASDGADWVLQIDTDEVLPAWEPLRAALDEAAHRGLRAVEWPMRILYRRLRDERFLQVTGAGGEPHFEYPGPIAVRPGVDLVECRRVGELFLRPVVRGDRTSLQVARPADQLEQRLELVSAEDAIWHNSWARPAAAVRSKLRSWGHANGVATWFYYYGTWLPAPLTWRALRDFHPLHAPLWPRLAPAPPMPFRILGG